MKFDPHAASEPVGKLLASAVANASHLAHVRSQRLDTEDLVIVEASVRDESGPGVVIWFNQRYLAKQLQPGRCVT